MAKTMSRRAVLLMGANAAILGVLGCNRKAAEATGDAMIAIGSIAVLIPHWLGKVIGAALVAGGSGLKIYFATSDGETKDVVLDLTPDEKKKIEVALLNGQKFVVTDPTGRKQPVDAVK